MQPSFKQGLLMCLLASVVGLSGCVSSSSSKVTVQEAPKFSKGQELNDLQRAKNEKAITDQEYETVRRKLMDRPN